MKSLGFGCDASSVVEALDASFLADGEFCANEVVAVNAISIRPIRRNLFWFTGSLFLPYSETRVGRECRPQLSNANCPACTIPIERHRVSLNRKSSPIVVAATNRGEPDFGKTNLQRRARWHTVSSVRCQMTWRVMEMQRAIGFLKKKKTICSDCEQETCDSRWLVFVFVSGTVVAPIES